MNQKAIIIGASSGIGKELAKVLSNHGFIVGLTGRRIDLLIELQSEIKNNSFIKQMDISKPSKAMNLLDELIEDMKGIDLIVISAGVGFINPELEWHKENDTIAINVTGFTAMANVAMKRFISQKSGHLVGISSIAALTGDYEAPSYNASKAFISNYMEGLRKKVKQLKLPITITDVKPGFVDTAMAQGEKLFWVASPQKAAKQIYQVINKRKNHAYITKRWRLIAWLLKIT